MERTWAGCAARVLSLSLQRRVLMGGNLLWDAILHFKRLAFNRSNMRWKEVKMPSLLLWQVVWNVCERGEESFKTTTLLLTATTRKTKIVQVCTSSSVCSVKVLHCLPRHVLSALHIYKIEFIELCFTERKLYIVVKNFRK